MKKKVHFFLHVFISIILLSGLNSWGQTIIDVSQNGNFENWTDGAPDNWMGPRSNISSANVNEYTTEAHIGDKACQLINTSDSHKRFTNEPFYILADTEYKVTYYVRGQGEIRNAFYRDGNYSGYSDYTAIDSDDWTEIVWTFEYDTAVDDVEVIFSLQNTDSARDHLQIDHVSITYEEPEVPELYVTPDNINGLVYVESTGPSDSQHFEISGINLDETDVTITAPKNFEASKHDDSYTDDITLEAYDGTATDIYIRLKSDLSIDEYSGEATISGGGADQLTVTASGEVIGPFNIPYANAFRTQEDNDIAQAQGFIINNASNESGAGGYLRIFPDGYLATPTIDFTKYDYLTVEFDATTYGGDQEQKLSVLVSNDNGDSYESLQTYSITGIYVTYDHEFDLTNTYNATEGKIKIEMTDGGASTRFRDYLINYHDTPAIVEVNDLETLRGGETDGTVYKLTGEAILTYQQEYKNKKWIQDDNAGIEIIDEDGIITTEYEINDGISGIIGTLDRNNNMLQLIPSEDPGPSSSQNNTPAVFTKELDELGENEQARLLLIEGVTFDEQYDGDIFQTEENYDITDPTGAGTFRTEFRNANYINDPIPMSVQNITAIVREFEGNMQITARSWSDFVPEDPTANINLSDAKLYDFGNVYVDNKSNVQFYYVWGSELTGDLKITAPSNFMVSTNCYEGFQQSISLSPTDGNVSQTKIYVRFFPTSTGASSGNITHNSADATPKNLSVSGSGKDCQIPSEYYQTATGIEEELMDQLHEIINDHNTIDYGDIWTEFENTDQKHNGKVWDIYSDLQCEEPPYEYVFFENQDSGTGGTQEGDVYNREHSWPRSWWGGGTSDTDTMNTDMFHVYPADKYVNAQRDNFIFGMVENPSWTSEAGHKLGTMTDHSNITAFEPIDEYKGDFARTFFYMVTRYKSRVADWAEYNNVEHMLDGSQHPAFEPWALEMLIEWHVNDPVSQKEINRNNAIYDIQGNRNPFIDNPEFVNMIWEEEEGPDYLAVSETNPEDNEQNIAIDTEIKVAFDREIAEANGFDDILLKDEQDNEILYTATIDDNILNIIPDDHLEYETEYVVLIPVDAVHELENTEVTLQDDYYFSFSTIIPKNLLSNWHFEHWEENKPIYWEWGETLDRLQQTTTNPLVGNYNVSLTPISSHNTLTQNFDEVFEKDKTYHGVVWVKGTDNVKARVGIRWGGHNAYGNYTELSGNEWIKITYSRERSVAGSDDGLIISVVESDEGEQLPITVGTAWLGLTEPPENWPENILAILNTNPQDGTENLPVETEVTLSFANIIQEGPADFTSISFEDTEEKPVDFITSITDNVLTIKPQDSLEYLTKYTVIIPEDAVADAENENAVMEEAVKINFTTEEEPILHTATFGVEDGNGILIAEVDEKEIASGEKVREGKDILFKAIPNEGYKIAEWIYNEEIVENYYYQTYLVDSIDINVNVAVKFETDDTSVEDIKTASITVYPNPATNLITVESDEMIKNIRLININGQVVINVAANSLSKEINVNTLRPGIYLMKINTNKGAINQSLQILR